MSGRPRLTDEERVASKRRRIEKQRTIRQNMSQDERHTFNEHRRSQETNETRESRNIRRRQLRMNRAEQRHNVLDISANFSELNILEFTCGEMNIECSSCKAKHFSYELPRDKRFTECCQKGKVVLDSIPIPSFLKALMTNQHENSKNFFNNIRSINSSLAFASMGANIAPPSGHGPYCFRIHGQVYHRAGALHPENGGQRKFAQLYVLEPEAALEQRMGMPENAKCNPQLMRELSAFMATINPFGKAFKMLYEVEQESIHDAAVNNLEPPIISMAIVHDRKSDQRRYNAPRSNEIAYIFQNADGEPPLERDLIIYCRVNGTNSNSRKTERISVLDPNLEPMVYPLFFPFGNQSWGVDLPLFQPPTLLNMRNMQTRNPRTRITQMQYYGYRLSVRDEFNAFLCGGKLTQQYFVDAYIKTEANRLNYIRQNQSKLRAEKYTGLMDYIQSEALRQGLLPGTAIILPSSFQGSPRNMAQNYQDAMAIVRKYGKPDFFITMTCNPKWVEITDNLLDGQSSAYRPDLVARVFKIKLAELIKDISKKHIFGTLVAKVYVIEFQKRGLPHAHILFIVKNEDKPKDAASLDKVISAEIPDVNICPRLHAIVTKHMLHGPCGEKNQGAPCMINGKCSKNFPKPFQNETIANSDGYPKYRRRNSGTTTVNGNIVDNGWIVPYNSYLCLKYNCHINVESCASIQSVKYLFKYVYKGHDCANIAIAQHSTLNHDEIKTYMDARYVSAPEAAWRLFSFKMHEQSHSIIRLPVHLPDEQTIIFTEENIQERIGQAAAKDTMLTAFFKLNQIDENANALLYHDLPNKYVFDKNAGTWKARRRGGNSAIGRMYSVNMNETERFCLRLLLLHVPGVKSFDDLKTCGSHTSSTYKEAAQRRGLFNDDATWDSTLADAIAVSMPRQLRDLFAYICIFASPSNAAHLFNKYKNELCEDFMYRHVHHNDNCSQCEMFALRDIQDTLQLHGKKCSDFGLLCPPNNLGLSFQHYDASLEKQNGLALALSLNQEQKIVFDTIMEAVNNDSHSRKCYFVDGPGGSGKTYLYKTLLCSIRGESNISLAVASTGIAANLLDGGRTYHSQFKLPVPTLDTSTSSMRMTSTDAELIRKCKLIIWDESTMAPGVALKAVDKLLKEIMSNDRPFGGKPILLGGDFRQTLPVVVHGNQAAIVEQSIKFSSLWETFEILKLHNNVRSIDLEYSDWLIKLGDGTLTNEYGLPTDVIEIPMNLICKDSIITEIFGETLSPNEVDSYSKIAILCPKNSDVDKVNEEVLMRFTGECCTYFSSDSIDDANDEDKQNYPIEFLNELAPSGMPLHKLKLCIGSIVILLRNLNTKRGLCNGTRLAVKELKPNLVIAEVLTGSAEKDIVFIPRIDLAPVNPDLPFVLRRRQFPIKLAFAMTINKAQGQTLEKVGLFLPEPVFAHGQLYVALSRVRKSSCAKIKILNGPHQGNLIPGSEAVFTRNIVYKEIFSK